MIIDVSVTEYHHSVTAHEIGLTRDRHTTSRLRERYVPSWFHSPNKWTWKADLTTHPGFQWYVDKYAEITTSDPWNDVVLFFRRLATVGPGPIQTGGLFYPGRYPLMNPAAMAGSAEALAGWFCETHYNWDLFTRPQGVSPDMVFHDSQSGRWALVEVKSTSQNKNVQTQLRTDMIKLLKTLPHTKLLGSSTSLYYVVLIMVQVVGPTWMWNSRAWYWKRCDMKNRKPDPVDLMLDG